MCSKKVRLYELGGEAVVRGLSEDCKSCFIFVFLVPNVVPGTK